MGEFFDIAKQESGLESPVRPEKKGKGRRKAYVLRQLGKTGNYIRLKISPIVADMQSPLQQALRLQDQNDPRAIQWYRKAIKEGEGGPDSWCNLGILESGSGWKSRAVHSFQEAIRLEPRHFEAQYNLANLYFDSGELDLARIHYDIASEISADYPPLIHQQALLALLDKQYAQAIQLLRRYLLLVDGDNRLRTERLIRRISADASMDGT